MRQGFLAVAALAAGLIAFSPAEAATAPAKSTGIPKIAVVDMQAVMTQCQRGQEAGQALKQKQNDLQAQADDLNNKRKAMKDALDKADPKATNHDQLLKQFTDADNAFQNFVGEARQLLQQRQQELFQPIQQELITVLDKYTKDNKIDILMGKGGGALMASDNYDVTKSVTEAMNKDWAAQPKPAPAPTAAPSASTH